MDSDDSATATVKRFTNRMKKLTQDNKCVAGSFTLPKDSSDYTQIIDEIKESGAETVFLAVSPSVATEFLKQAESKGLLSVLYLGTREWNNSELIKLLKSNPSFNAAFPTEQGQNTETETSDVFVRAYKAKYGENMEPSERTTVAFDAYCMALDAISRAYDSVLEQDPDKLMDEAATEAEGRAAKEAWQTAIDTGIPTGTQIRQALSETKDFKGASGIINYAGKNEATKSITVTHIAGGAESESYTVE